MSLFLSQVALDGILFIANQGDASVAETLAGLDTQLDSNNPVTVAGVGATNTAFLGKRQQFVWESLAPSFSFTAAFDDLLADSCITDWNGIASDIIPDSTVNTGNIMWDGETAEFSVDGGIAGLMIVRVLADVDNTAGGAAEWDFDLLLDGASIAQSHRTEWTALANRQAVEIEFEIKDIDAGDVLCIAARPTAGTETLIIRKWIPQFIPVRN